jgi:hypothetical protein
MKFDKTTIGVVFLLLASTALAVTLLNEPVKIDSEPTGLEVTVYNSDLGVVKEYRSKFLPAGESNVLYENVASMIDPTSVRLRSINGNIDVVEQSFLYDIVSKEKILEKYLDKEITAYQIHGDVKEMVKGTLLSYSSGQIILKDENGEIKIIAASDFVLPKLPEGLITKPTLQWTIDAAEAKNHTLELSYMTGGMTWQADYVAVTNSDDSKLDLNGWVTVTNNAGTTFKDTTLKLVAGDVRRVSTPSPGRSDAMYAMESKAAGGQFTEQSLFEYHMYDLQRKTTLRNNEQKQISLLSADGVGIEKEYVYDDIQSWWWYGNTWSDSGEKKVNVKLNFKNSQDNNLGIPLPKGTVRVFKKDSEGQLQFIGEDSIDHTPKDEVVRLFIGQAFDIVGSRKQVDMNILSGWYEYTWEVTFRNHKDTDIVVTSLERTGGDWQIAEENFVHTKDSNNLIQWKVPVKANGETKLTYTIRYKRWD